MYGNLGSFMLHAASIFIIKILDFISDKLHYRY